jgi:cation transport ATPase
VFLGYILLGAYIPQLHPEYLLTDSWRGGWIEWGLGWVFTVLVVGTLAYAWVWPAWALLSRSARAGRLGQTLARGLAVALAFVGSLFGSFWAATSYWRSYFFDSRVVPAVMLVVSVVAMSGCGDTVTYGEVRRRELFHALLMAWVLGLALMWRWWSRSRRPQDGKP